jgi:hypothetical protein
VALLTALAVVVLAPLSASALPQERGTDDVCTSSVLDEGKEEALKPSGDLRSAFSRISRGIETLERLEGSAGRLCRPQLAEAYVHLGACVFRLYAAPPNETDDRLGKGLPVDGFQRLQAHAATLAFEHALFLDPDRARSTLEALRRAEAIDDNLSDVFRRAEVFVRRFAGAMAGPGAPRQRLTFALGAFVAKQPHRGDAPMFGPYAFAGVRRGRLSAGPTVGWSFGGGATAVVGLAVHVDIAGRGGITAGYGWRRATRTGESTLHGFGVGAAYRFGGGARSRIRAASQFGSAERLTGEGRGRKVATRCPSLVRTPSLNRISLWPWSRNPQQTRPGSMTV